jgi:hypothetical protein
MKLQIYIDSSRNCQIYKGGEHWDSFSTLFSGLTEVPLPLIATQDGIVGVSIDCAVFKMPRPEGRVVVSVASLFEKLKLKMSQMHSMIVKKEEFPRFQQPQIATTIKIFLIGTLSKVMTIALCSLSQDSNALT